MMIAPLGCLNSWSQTDYPVETDTISDNIVSIPVSYIRLANTKLIEHKYCDYIIATKDSVIALQNLQYEIADSLYRAQLVTSYQSVATLQRQVEKQNKKVKILTGSTIGCAGLFVLMLLIK